eukprot:3939185-Rhodomonas_salina.1
MRCTIDPRDTHCRIRSLHALLLCKATTFSALSRHTERSANSPAVACHDDDVTVHRCHGARCTKLATLRGLRIHALWRFSGVRLSPGARAVAFQVAASDHIATGRVTLTLSSLAWELARRFKFKLRSGPAPGRGAGARDSDEWDCNLGWHVQGLEARLQSV